MEFNSFGCRICGGRLIPKLNELVCSNCNFIQHPPKENVINISCENLKKKLDNKENLLILDIREKWEHAMANINKSKLIPLRELKNKISELNKNQSIITVCHYGDRSLYAARYLIQQGFKDVKNLEGGIESWSVKIDNSLKRY